MNYIVFDLEWNQGMSSPEKVGNLTSEIIEIGAVKLDCEWNIVDCFSELIKPQVYMKLHYAIKEITNIKKEEFLQGDSFENVIERFFDWCGKDYVFCTWGDMDLFELQNNMNFYHIEGYIEKRPIIYYDVQRFFGMQFGSEKEIRNLEYAIDILNIQKEEPFHRALSDAKYTALILQKMDKVYVLNNYSIDCYHNPKMKSEEFHLRFDSYSKYVSREFDKRGEVFKSREVSSSRCCKCGKGAKKKIRWFTSNAKCYYCLAYCNEHGFIKGKIAIKKTWDGKYYAMKTLKMVDEESAIDIYRRKEVLKQKKKGIKKI